MKTSINILIILILSLIKSIYSYSQESNPFNVIWDNGFKVESVDENFKLKFGGRIMWDNAFFFQDNALDSIYGKLNNGSEFRRVRFFNSGTIYGNIDYKMQLDFTGGDATFKDVYITIKDILCVGNLRVGHFKEPMRLVVLTSSKNLTFMEPSFLVNIIPERNSGIMLFNDYMDKRLSTQIGVFRRSNSYGDDKTADDGYAITGRVSGLAIKNKEKKQLLHLAVGYSYRKPGSKEYKISSRSETHLGTKYISTGVIESVSDMSLLNIEGALVLNSLSFQGEYSSSVVIASSETQLLSSYYVQTSYFLTGESRNYKSSMSGFGRLKPRSNFGGTDNGVGTLEIAIRYSNINLNSGELSGGEMSDITAGVNWYLNPSMRIMTNYVIAEIKGKGGASIFQMRFQVDF